MFERFRRSASSSTQPPRFGCYGKLPFDREFLRFHLDSAEGRWITEWIDGAHERIAARREAGDQPADVELRAIFAWDGGRRAGAALLRPSRDGGGRFFPFCVFCALPADGLENRWHLTPLCLEPLWQAMGERIVDAPPTSRDELAGLLDETPIEAGDVERAAERFAESASAAVVHPWQSLNGSSAEEARALASTFVQLGAAQRSAGDRSGGVIVHLPLAGALVPAPLDVAVWMRFFAAVAGGDRPWPAAIEVRRSGEPASRSLCLFGREAGPEDLAYLMMGGGEAGIDELRDPWSSEPSADEDVRSFQALAEDSADCLAGLWERMA